MSKTVICAGPHRSGSTWLYNAVRLIPDPAYACFVNSYDSANTAERHVIKTHRYKRNLKADAILFSSRNWLDVGRSAIRMGLTDEAGVVDYAKKELSLCFLPWKAQANLIVPYEKMILDKPKYIQLMANVLSVEVDPILIHESVENLSPPKEGFDLLTHLHPNHIGPPSYEVLLSPQTVKELNEIRLS